VTDPFQAVAGHQRPLALLRHQIESGRLAHAYLFVGEPMLGKTTVAQALAAAVLPPTPLARNPDYWEDDRAEALKIDELRLLPDRQPERHAQTLQSFLSMRPAQGERRVALISDVGRLPGAVQGILLKTLEEPHPGRIIILTTPSLSPFVVLPTVVSRCQRISFHGVEREEVVRLLLARGAEEATARLLADLCRGRPGWGVRALADADVVERHERWSQRLDETLGAPQDVALALAAELDSATSEWRRRGAEAAAAENPVDMALASWQLHLRQRMADDVQPQARARWARLLERSYDVVGYLEQNVSTRLALEVFLLEVAHAG
jgi:DNA polymerase III subunit delta'